MSGASPLPDIVRPGLRVIFVGINPGLRSAAIGHHFAGHSNRFWKLLYESRLVPEPINCEQDARLPEWGYGMTNLIRRPTAGIDALRTEEYAAGLRDLRRKVAVYRPEILALVGVTIHRKLFPSPPSGRKRRLRLGPRRETIDGARLFLLPNPTGRNAT